MPIQRTTTLGAALAVKKPLSRVGAVVAESKAAAATAVFPERVRFDGKRLVVTGITLPAFNYSALSRRRKKKAFV